MNELNGMERKQQTKSLPFMEGERDRQTEKEVNKYLWETKAPDGLLVRMHLLSIPTLPNFHCVHAAFEYGYGTGCLTQCIHYSLARQTHTEMFARGFRSLSHLLSIF